VALSRRRRWKAFLLVAVLLIAALVAMPWVLRTFWSRRASNPVRRGVARASELGCFSCHGAQGSSGIPDPGSKDLAVPAWSGGMYMMYVKDDRDIQRYIQAGSVPKVEPGEGQPADAPPPRAAIGMPAYRDALRGTDLQDLTAAYKVLSGMVAPPSGSPAERGLALATQWKCFACHGPGGSGGFPNPGSFAGFVPGWYGPDFKDLVRNRAEFDSWVRTGTLERLAKNKAAAYFMSHQKIGMPDYRGFTDAELEGLWGYAQWLAGTGGGTTLRKEAAP